MPSNLTHPDGQDGSDSAVIATGEMPVSHSRIAINFAEYTNCVQKDAMEAGVSDTVLDDVFPDPDCWLYAVRRKADCCSPVKFGISRGLAERLRKIQTGHAYPLVTLAHVPGGRRLEAAVHDVLRPFRTHGEWFGVEDSDGMTRFATLLKRDSFRAAIMRWHKVSPHFKTRVRAWIAKERDADWLAFILDDSGTGLTRLFKFIDDCPTFAPSPREHENAISQMRRGGGE